jgi:hypothetical protein
MRGKETEIVDEGKRNGDQRSWLDGRVSNRTPFSRSPAALTSRAALQLRFIFFFPWD